MTLCLPQLIGSGVGLRIQARAGRILFPRNLVICAERCQAESGWCLEWRRYKPGSCGWSLSHMWMGGRDSQFIAEEKNAAGTERKAVTGDRVLSMVPAAPLPLGSRGPFCIHVILFFLLKSSDFYFFLCHTFFPLFKKLCTPDIWKFLNQGLNLSCSCGNAGSFNPLCWVGSQTHTSVVTQTNASDS